MQILTQSVSLPRIMDFGLAVGVYSGGEERPVPLFVVTYGVACEMFHF